MDDATATAMLEALKAEAATIRSHKAMYENNVRQQTQLLAIAEAKIIGFEAAAKLYRQAAEAAVVAAAEAAAAARSPAAVETDEARPKRQRRLTGHWQSIMQSAALFGEFDYEDLAKFGQSVGHNVPRETLRAQMSGYKKAGLVESSGEGRFKITDLGRKASRIDERDPGVTAPNENGAQNGQAVRAPETGNEDVPAPSEPPSTPNHSDEGSEVQA